MQPRPIIRKRDRENSIKRLLEAGVTVFSAHGYDAATTKLIAKQAGINESLISRYFDGKAGLLVEIIRGFLDRECEHGTLRNYPNGESLEEEIFNFFQHKVNHYWGITPFLKVVFSRAIIDPAVAQEMQKATFKGGAPVLIERLKGYQDKGLIRSDVNLERTAFTICNTSFSMGFLGHIVMGFEKEFIQDSLRDFAKNFAIGIR